MTEEREVQSSNSYAVVEGVKIAELSPRPAHVLVRWLKKTETKGGVLIPQYRWRKGYMKGEVLKAGHGCDARLSPGTVIQFDSLADKEFLGVQDPVDRDTVFFLREEDIHGIITEDDGLKRMVLCNEYVLIRPDEGEAEKAGLSVPDSARKQTMFVWHGVLLGVGPEVVDGGRYDGLRGLVSQRIVYQTEMANGTIMNGRELTVIRADYIIGVFEPEEALSGNR